MQLNEQEVKNLVESALAARLHAYAPYSNFLVGAVILSEDGHIFEGCNVENASFGLTICAERSAVSAAIAKGQRQWRAIAVASLGAVTPCGACRQVLHEFGKEIEVILVDAESCQIRARWTTGELLPGAFSL
ncbi:MAG: cytidine deaminase [Pirellulaceae bacterium]|nr:cytidine deaminase [Pirellulaceae bacterium]